MKHILSHRIVKHLAKEERDTKSRYVYLGKAYKIPALVRAGKQEGQHSKIFMKLEKRGIKRITWKFPRGRPAPNNYLWDGQDWVKRRN